MTVSSQGELFAALGRGDGEALIGTQESEWLDFKQTLYVPFDNDRKLELAKDVTALANSGGGVLVIGYRTHRDDTMAREVASELSPVRRDLVNFQQYQQTVEDWTYPPIRNLEMGWWLEDGGTGVFTIEVRATPEAQWPCLVPRVNEAGLRRGLLVGIFERSGNRVSRLSPGEIHTQIQLGRVLQRTGQPTPPPVPTLPEGPSEEERRQRLESDTRDAELLGHRRYFLQAWPPASVEVQQLHDPGADSFRSILRDPPQIRQHYGFGLATAMEPLLIPGGGLRIVVSERHSLSLQRNGLLTWVVTAGSEFLAWADERRQRHSIAPVPLVESTLEFVRLFKLEVLPRCEPSPPGWAVAGGMADLLEGGERSSLSPGTLRSFPSPQPAQSNDFTFGPMQFRDESAGAVAFRILHQVYAEFGIGDSQIPYSQDGEVSEELIRNIR